MPAAGLAPDVANLPQIQYSVLCCVSLGWCEAVPFRTFLEHMTRRQLKQVDPMKRALLAATLLASALLMMPLAARAQPIEGLYVGAGGGANFLANERVRSATVDGQWYPAKIGFDTGWAALGSAGWGFGNGVRVELEGNWRSNDIANAHVPAGYATSGQETKYGVMANVLFDMDIGSPYVFPYLGAGAGALWVQQNHDLVAPGGGVASVNSSSGASFAYQAIVGAGFPIPGVPGLSATTEFRYVGVNGYRTYTGTATPAHGASVPATVTTSENNNFDLLLGVRYAFNVAPPVPPAAAPAAAAAPAPAPARSYLVFFDWDSTVLNARARQIVAEAAQNATHVQVTRIEVAGHTDSTGTPAYNLALSRRRAEAVAAELVNRGVARQAIAIQAFGETKPLVATADGVREPQNRRVEIVLN